MSKISKLHRYSNEREIEHRGFLLWAMQAKLNRNLRAVSRAIGRSHTSVSNYLHKHSWQTDNDINTKSSTKRLARNLRRRAPGPPSKLASNDCSWMPSTRLAIHFEMRPPMGTPSLWTKVQ